MIATLRGTAMIDVADVTQALGGLNASVQKMQQVAQDYQKLAQLVAQLTADNDRLKEELAAVKAERDEYENAIHYLTRRETAITVEDIEEAERDGYSLKDIIALLETEEPSNGNGSP
jgi:septal ring factor EnvC (AmiA/AmiB activator)